MMYIHHMVRTQIYLDEPMHARLREMARQQGKSVSDLIREALARSYGVDTLSEDLKALEAVTGIWRDRKDLGTTDEYVRRLRKDTHRLKKPR